MTPLVSVIIPVYNAEKYIRETIISVVNQTYTNWEIILVNDGSTDQSESVIMEFVSEKIHYLKKENGGVSTARNLGIEKAKGDYIAFLDADDVWLPDNLVKKVNVLEDKEIDWVFSDMYEVDVFLNNRNLAPCGKDSNILQSILKWEGEVVPGPASNVVVKRKCFEKGLRFDPQFSTAADQDFTLSLAANYKGKRISEALWLYRQISTSMSRNIAVMEKDHIGVYKKAAQKGLFDNFLFKQQCFSNLYLILAGSWWVNGNDKARAVMFLSKSVLNYPPVVYKLLQKISGK